MKGYIYKYTFPDGKVYIGQTVRPIAARHREHTMPSTGKVNVGFWEAWQRFGEAKLDVIESIDESDHFALKARLDSLEIKYIEKYKALDPQYGYNRMRGGFGAGTSQKVLTKAFKKVFNETWYERGVFYSTLIELIRQSYDNPINLDEEQTLFIREVGLPGVDPPYRKYIKLSVDGTLSFRQGRGYYADFDRGEALDWLVFSVKDFAELEANELARDVEEFVLSNADKYLSEGVIQQFSKDGTLIKEFGSITEVLHDLNLSYSANIYNALRGQQKTAYGYIWRWKNKSNTELEND